MAVCVDTCVCIYIDEYIISYIRKFSMYKYKTQLSKHDTTAN